MPPTKNLKPLHRQPDFILSIFIPFFVSTLIGLSIIYAESSRELCFRADCYENFVQLFKVPFAILALAFPLAGMVAAYHRSIEATEQIKIAQSNNTFSNFIKHRDDFTEYLEEYLEQEDCKCELVEARRIYRLTYPENSYDRLETEIPDGLSNELLLQIENINKILENMSTSKTYYEEDIVELFWEIYRINARLKLLAKKGYKYFIKYESITIHAIIFDELEPLTNIDIIFAISNRIKSFGHLKVPSPPAWLDDEELTSAILAFMKNHAKQ